MLIMNQQIHLWLIKPTKIERKIINRMGANLCLKNINDKHSPTKGINVIITDKITIKAKEIAQCRELVSILYILLFINITNSYFIG